MAPRSDQDPSDEALARAAIGGEVRALEALLDRHQGRVLRILRFLGVPDQDREDVAQEVFVRVFRHLKGFRAGSEFGAWLYRLTVNAAHDYRTRAGRRGRGETPFLEGDDRQDPRPGPEESAHGRDLRMALGRALESLGERERTIFVLREIEQLSSREVARALGITTITVRRHLSRARRRLRELLGEAEEGGSPGVERIARIPPSCGPRNR